MSIATLVSPIICTTASKSVRDLAAPRHDVNSPLVRRCLEPSTTRPFAFQHGDAGAAGQRPRLLAFELPEPDLRVAAVFLPRKCEHRDAERVRRHVIMRQLRAVEPVRVSATFVSCMKAMVSLLWQTMDYEGTAFHTCTMCEAVLLECLGPQNPSRSMNFVELDLPHLGMHTPVAPFAISAHSPNASPRGGKNPAQSLSIRDLKRSRLRSFWQPREVVHKR